LFLSGQLKKGSILVNEGDRIDENELIGHAGNSGWTERAHLHMQLIYSDSPNYWTGIGISTRFANKNLYKNRFITLSANEEGFNRIS
jgi:murein DD-endopeptidase MepM/ murein hydrolase activator NlpD